MSLPPQAGALLSLMFHANGWNLPFACTLVGAKQVYLGPHLDPPALLRILERERATFTAGVPTIWLAVLQALDQNPGAYDLSHLRVIITGGSAAPRSMIEGFQERHGLKVLHIWGMTEMAPLGSIGYLPCALQEASSSPGQQSGVRGAPETDVLDALQVERCVASPQRGQCDR